MSYCVDLRLCRNIFLLMSIPRNLILENSLTGILSIESSTDSDSALSFYIAPITIKSVLVAFRVSLFQITHLLIEVFASWVSAGRPRANVESKSNLMSSRTHFF